MNAVEILEAKVYKNNVARNELNLNIFIHPSSKDIEYCSNRLASVGNYLY